MIQFIKKGTYTLKKLDKSSHKLSLDKKKMYIITPIETQYFIFSAQFEKFDGEDGTYRLYRVKDEIAFSNALHLELFNEKRRLQYLLPAGLPARKSPKKIIPTDEVITKMIF